MFYDQSESDWWDERGGAAQRSSSGGPADWANCGEGAILAPVLGGFEGEEDETFETPKWGGYAREVIQEVWELAEVVAGVDPALWRRDEFGDWIRRLDYGRRGSKFGWEIFDPGVGRHAQGVYAMRPMQWEAYVRQYETYS